MLEEIKKTLSSKKTIGFIGMAMLIVGAIIAVIGLIWLFICLDEYESTVPAVILMVSGLSAIPSGALLIAFEAWLNRIYESLKVNVAAGGRRGRHAAAAEAEEEKNNNTEPVWWMKPENENK